MKRNITMITRGIVAGKTDKRRSRALSNWGKRLCRDNPYTELMVCAGTKLRTDTSPA